ncbi:hypothetical protein FZ103_10395 [Streptomonospora sp. PA3]|uniref:hypothetical protein n=1 Tax=Streptomonospora sp. PA3 TaxID=2607326 RepID=UPI0012DE8B7C|nr:hypothetical protein [Streptomonospora sp. PA3]MUL41580.1 hypothetical protein [Streptomonospora sp. PA3]
MATPGHRGGWLSLSFALTDPAFQEIGLSHAVWAPTADQLAERIAAQDALAAGVATAMSLHPPAHGSADPLADVRAELAPLARDVAVRVLCQRAGIYTS